MSIDRLFLLAAFLTPLPSAAQTADSVELDMDHPKHMVDVFEVTSRGEWRPIFLHLERADVARRSAHVRTTQHMFVDRFTSGVAQRVDRQSRIVIRFARQWILNNLADIDAEISIEARSSGSRELSVPGYAVVGEERESAVLRLRSISDVRVVFSEIARGWEDFLDLNEEHLDLQAEGDSLRRQIIEALADSVRINRSATRQLGPDIGQSLRDSARLGARLETLEAAPDSVDVDAQLLALRDSITGRTAEVVRLSDSLSNLQREANRIGARVDSMRATKGLPEQARFWNEFREAIKVEWSVLDVKLARLTDSVDTTLDRVITRFAQRDAAGIRALAMRLRHEIRDSLFALPELRTDSPDEALIRRQERLIDALYRHFGEIQTVALSSRLLDDLTLGRELISSLKDTEIVLNEQRVSAGDEISIIIANGQNRSELHRELEITMRVEEFGFIRRISDSFLFVRRIGVNSSENAQAVDDARDTAEQDGTTETVATPREVIFEPAPGVTLGWTYKPRDGFMSWLQPGFGINVSFPRFGSNFTSVRVDDTSAGDPNQPATVTFEQVTQSSEIDVAAGLMLSLFDNAVTAGFGYNLTSAKPRFFGALGFSFIGLGRQAARAAQ